MVEVRSYTKRGPARLISPMKFHPDDADFINNNDYWAERKWDGTRMEVIKIGNKIQLISSSSIKRGDALGYTNLYPNIVTELQKIKSDVILDGEMVFLKKGSADDVFLTCAAKPETIKAQGLVAKLMVFDILWKDEEFLMNVPIEERRRILESVITPRMDSNMVAVDVTKIVSNDKPAFFKMIVASGGEGVVLKKKGSVYEEGERSYLWRKHKKTSTGDYVAVGYTKGNGARSGTFGAVVMAEWDVRANRFKYVGHTSGFNNADLSEWKRYFDSQPTSQNPFNNLAEVVKADAVKLINPETARVIEVGYLNKTPSGVPRHPFFTRIRLDKSPRQAEG